MDEVNGKFHSVATREGCKNWETLVKRSRELYDRADDIRSPFARDYTRILHSTAYRRLKHKTQVFFNSENDHVCTRMEHVAHVESVAYTLALRLGLNEELTRAIAFGHDLGHAPFGHHGEKVINELSQKYLGKSFWHEKNGLRMVDSLELLEDYNRVKRNLNLTYAVRDGIISHCGEIDQNGLVPREELFDLNEFTSAGQSQPATWEGCVVKLSDKIAYLGRDIEDALSLGFISAEQLNEIGSQPSGEAVNTTVIMHEMIIDACANSSPQDGIRMSENSFARLKAIKDFNYEYIYRSPRFRAFEEYARLIIKTLFDGLYSLYNGGFDYAELEKYSRVYPSLASAFGDWLKKYCNDGVFPENEENARYHNEKIYGSLESPAAYAQAVLDFISGMTDPFAIRLFDEQLRF